MEKATYIDFENGVATLRRGGLVENQQGILEADASLLRFPPGRWPWTIRMQEGGDDFQRADIERDDSGADNDVVWVKYRQPGKTGLQLIVFND